MVTEGARRALTLRSFWRGTRFGLAYGLCKSRAALVASALTTVLVGLVAPAQVALVGGVVEGFDSGRQGWTFILLLVLLAASFGIQSIINTLRSVFSQRLSLDLSRSAQQDLFERLESWELSDVENPDRRDKLQVLLESARDRIASFIESTVSLVSLAISSFSVILVLLNISPVVAALVSISAFGPIVITPYLFRLWSKVADDAAPISRLASVLGVYLVSPPGFADARANRLLGVLTRTLRDLLGRHRQLLVKAIDREALAGLVVAGWVTVALTGALIVLSLGGRSPGEVAMVLTALTSLSGIIGIVASATNLAQTTPFISELGEELSKGAQKGLQEPDGGQSCSAGSITISDVTFGYSSDVDVLRDVSTHFEVGSITAIVGDNGAGKTTLLRLLQGMYAVTTGKVYVENERGEIVGNRLLPSIVGTMTQQAPRPPVLLREYLDPLDRLSDGDILTGLARVRLRFLGEADLRRRIGIEYNDGLAFSEGQWQRVSIARMLLSGVPVWLLDEPSSALAPEAESELLEILRNEAAHRIVVVVSHRLATVAAADSVLVLAGGRIIEKGYPKNLLADRSSELARMFRGQVSGVSASR